MGAAVTAAFGAPMCAIAVLGGGTHHPTHASLLEHVLHYLSMGLAQVPCVPRPLVEGMLGPGKVVLKAQTYEATKDPPRSLAGPK